MKCEEIDGRLFCFMEDENDLNLISTYKQEMVLNLKYLKEGIE